MLLGLLCVIIMFDNVKVIPFLWNLIKILLWKWEIINRFTCHEMCESKTRETMKQKE